MTKEIESEQLKMMLDMIEDLGMEDKYKDRPKIAFHQLTEEGDRLFMQAKRDRVWNTLGWSLIGNFAAIATVQMLSARPPKRWQHARFVK